MSEQAIALIILLCFSLACIPVRLPQALSPTMFYFQRLLVRSLGIPLVRVAQLVFVLLMRPFLPAFFATLLLP